MPDPLVSIVVLSYRHPEVIEVCLRTLQITDGVDYEVVVVDNASTPETIVPLQQAQADGKITALFESPTNTYFSEGNNIGVAYSNPASEYILLLNSDVAILRPDWLTKMLAWMNGTAAYWPNAWGTHPTIVKPGPLDIVSLGWSHQADIEPGHCRPEGFCCMFRRKWWTNISTDFPMANGLEEMQANAIRNGARCGVLSQYGSYIIHRECASSEPGMEIHDTRRPDIPGWFLGLEIECLDFTLGPNEHSSYLLW